MIAYSCVGQFAVEGRNMLALDEKDICSTRYGTEICLHMLLLSAHSYVATRFADEVADLRCVEFVWKCSSERSIIA